MLITGIKNRPVYDRLEPFHESAIYLVIGQSSGGTVMRRLLSEMPEGEPVEVLYSSESFAGQYHSAALRYATQS